MLTLGGGGGDLLTGFPTDRKSRGASDFEKEEGRSLGLRVVLVSLHMWTWVWTPQTIRCAGFKEQGNFPNRDQKEKRLEVNENEGW